jgi:hypothetical protein
MQRRNHGVMARRDARSNSTEMPRNPEYFRGNNVYEMARKFCRSSLQGSTYREDKSMSSRINVLTNHCEFGYTTFIQQAPERNSYCAAKPTKGDTTMNNVKKIAVSLLILCMMTGFTQAATHHHESKPDATLRLSGGSFALGIGVNWGSGTLTYKGKDYPVKVKGLSIGKVGMTSSSANGEVFNLKHLQDFNVCHKQRAG